jgi:hypothetical protein
MNINKIIDDVNDAFLPADENNWDKIPEDLEVGQKVGWWFEDDDEDYDYPPYEGIVVPIPGSEINNNKVDIAEMIIVRTNYPIIKDTSYEIRWFAIKRLLNVPELKKIIKL